MLNMRDIHKLGWQVLPLLRLCPENKTQRNTDKAEIDGAATSKKNMRKSK
jgi:hypothetical protein